MNIMRSSVRFVCTSYEDGGSKKTTMAERNIVKPGNGHRGAREPGHYIIRVQGNPCDKHSVQPRATTSNICTLSSGVDF